MATLEELVVRIKADTSQLQAEMNKAQGIVKGSADGMKSSLGGVAAQARALLPALSAVAFVSFAKGALQAADRLNDLALRTGIAASTLSALNIPLLQGGSNVEEFASSVNRMNNVIGEAAKGGNQGLVDTFNKLGLSITALMQLSPEDQFYQISRALNEIKTQAEFTNTGMAIFGRSFSTLAPLIRGADGDLAGFVDRALEAGNVLTQENLDTIDKFGDNWTAAIEQIKIDMLALTPILQGVLSAFELLAKLNPITVASNLGKALGEKIRDSGLPANTSYERPDISTFEKILLSKEKADAASKAVSGRNPNVDSLKASAKASATAKESLAEYNTQLDRKAKMDALAPQQQVGLEAYYKTADLAKKAGFSAKEIEEQAKANERKAESIYSVSEAQQEAARTAELLRDKLSDALTSAIVNFDSASDSARNFARAIASMIIQKSIADPLANAIVGNGSAGSGILSGIGSILGFADGGSPPVGVPSIVGERGPELFIPKMSGTIIPNDALGGGNQIMVNQYFQVSNDVPALIQAHIRNAAPVIASAAHDAVFSSIQRGGSAAKIVGVR